MSRKFSDQFLSIIPVILTVRINLIHKTLIVFRGLQEIHTMIKRSRLIYKLIEGTGRHERAFRVLTDGFGTNSG